MKTNLVVRILLSLILLSGMALAQIGGGSIVGDVTDPSGGAVPNATVRATNVQTNVVNRTITNSQGYYEFPLLPAGLYVLDVSFKGFEDRKTNEFTLNTGTRPRFDFALGVGATTQSVTVEAASPLVNATTTELGVVIEQRKIESIPLNGRNYQQLVGLQPGVVNKPSTTVGGRGGIEFNGAPAFGNNLMMDGIDTSFGEHNGPGQDTGLGGGSIINSVSIEAVEEFKTTSSAFSAEYGRATGGVVNITTKSGTNLFHGTLFEFVRNDALDSNTFDNNRRKVAKPPLRFNQFGGNLGGPIQKDKLFFFFNYEGLRATRGTTSSGNVPTQLLLDSVSPAMRTHLKGLAASCSNPIPNQPFLCFHFRTDTRTNDENTYLTRVDYQLSAQHRLSFRCNQVLQQFDQPGSGVRPANRLIYPTRTYNVLAQDSWTISPRLFNEIRAGYSRYFLDRNNATLATEPAWMEVGSAGFASDFESRLRTVSNTYQLADNFTWVHAAHTLKFGFDIRDVRNARLQATNPTHYYNTIADLIADKPINVRVSPGNPGRGFKSVQTGIYVQDDWRLNRRLQVNAGLRYEYYEPLSGPFNIATRDFFGAYAPKNSRMWQPDRNNFGPRLGLVFDAKGDQKWIVRAGGGITYAPQQPFFYYDFSFIDPRIPFSAFLAPADVPSDVSLNFPFQQAYINRLAADPSLLPKGLILGRATVDPNRRDEYVGHWNLSVQHSVTKALAMQATYAGSRGVHLLATTIQNLYVPGTTQRVNPNLGQVSYIEGSGRHFYNSFQFSTNYRASRGGTVDFYYTLAKNMSYGASDNSDGPRNFDIQDFSNFRGSYGPKAGDIRHHAVIVYSYEIPVPHLINGSRAASLALANWSLQGIMDWRSGLAMNILSNLNTPQNGQATPWGFRPDVVAGQSLYSKDGAVPQGSGFQFYTKSWVNPNVVDIVTPYNQRRFGNAGYDLVYGPRSWSFDASAIKNFHITERHQVEFRAELFNALNHPNDFNPDLNVFSGRFDAAGLPIKNPTFGLVNGKGGNRNIQFGLKYRF